jgi:hypothetical protein
MSYPYALAADTTQGIIDGINVRWQESAWNKLYDNVERLQQPPELLKALTENFLYLAARRLGNTSIKITYVTYPANPRLIMELLTNCL